MSLAPEATEVKMADCSNTSVKKIFRAKKTMTASCRQQIAILNKLKSCTKEGIAVEGLTSLLPTDGVQQSERSSKANCPEQTNSKLSKSLESLNQNIFSNELKVSVAQINSRSNTGYSYKEAFGISSASEKSHGHFSTSMVTADVSHNANSGFTKQKADYSSPKKPPLQSSPVSKGLQHLKSFSEKIKENSNSKNDQNPNSDLALPCHIKDNTENIKGQSKKTFSTVHVQNSTSSIFGLNNLSESTTQDLSNNCDTSIGANQRKRVHSESNDVSCCKRNNASLNVCSEPEKINVILEKIQCLIENRIQSFFKESLDQRMEDLSRRVSLIKCMGNHGNDIARYRRKARKLERRIKSVLSVQKEAEKQRNNLHNIKREKVATVNDKLASDQKLLSKESLSSSPKTVITTDSHEKISNILNTKDIQGTECNYKTSAKKESSSLFSDSVLHASEGSVSLVPPLKPICRRECYLKENKKSKSIIDLTKDEENDCKEHNSVCLSHLTRTPDIKDIKLEECDACLEQKNPALSDTVKMPFENKVSGICNESSAMELSPKPLHTQCKKTKTGPIKAEEQYSNKATDLKLEGKCSVTQDNASLLDTTQMLYKIKASGCNESEMTKSNTNPPHTQVTSSNCDSGSKKLQPPQKPELRLTQVQNPKGIALSWNINKTDPNCAPAESYCLYVHKVDASVKKVLWKKIGEIKALPLPMACTLTQFVDGSTYSFALRAKDPSGRFGPLCDIQSVTLQPSVKAAKGS
eukprot:XP_002939234.2 PREDICTED: activating transcription factor 7-interacting protein 2 isoform X2 [Xenopus tropicalis]